MAYTSRGVGRYYTAEADLVMLPRGVAHEVAGTHNSALDNIPADDVVSFILEHT